MAGSINYMFPLHFLVIHQWGDLGWLMACTIADLVIKAKLVMSTQAAYYVSVLSGFHMLMAYIAARVMSARAPFSGKRQNNRCHGASVREKKRFEKCRCCYGSEDVFCTTNIAVGQRLGVCSNSSEAVSDPCGYALARRMGDN